MKVTIVVFLLVIVTVRAKGTRPYSKPKPTKPVVTAKPTKPVVKDEPIPNKHSVEVLPGKVIVTLNIKESQPKTGLHDIAKRVKETEGGTVKINQVPPTANKCLCGKVEDGECSIKNKVIVSLDAREFKKGLPWAEEKAKLNKQVNDRQIVYPSESPIINNWARPTKPKQRSPAPPKRRH